MQELRIGYVPYSPQLNRPGDRRRFCYYASKRNISFEIAQPSETYDVVVVSEAADITVWSRYPRERGKIVFDFVDSYLSIPRSDPKGMLRGLAKFASRQHRHLRLNYWTALEDMCRRADATICTTQEQKEKILPFCPNVYVILDSQGTVIRGCKQDYSAQEVFHFVWEGLAVNIRQLLEIKEAMESLRKTRPFLIHVITELRYGRFLHGRFGQRNTIDDAREILPEICLYGWNEHMLSEIVRRCDLALVPIPLHDPLLAGKPENRLLLFWRMGMPVLVSATPAHVRAMKGCGLDMALKTQQDWREALEYYTTNEEARRHAGQSGKHFAEAEYSEERTLALWDQVFRSIDRQIGDMPQPRHPAEIGYP